MLRSDAQVRDHKVDNIVDNINAIHVDAIANIERELDPYDVVSMVFLLYETPETALQRLMVHERVARDVGDKNLGLLHDWAQHATATRPAYKYEFLEALTICQINNVIRKLGFQNASVQKKYLPNNIHTSIHINPMKKALYKLCENITSDILTKLQNALKSYDIDTTEYQTCEQVLLELICKKFVSVDACTDSTAAIKGKYQVERLVTIIKTFPELQKIADDIRELQRTLNNEPGVSGVASTSTPICKDDQGDEPRENFNPQSFQDIYEILSKLNIEEDTSGPSLKSDTQKAGRIGNVYPIKNPKSIGVCYIINQEDFYPSKQSIENNPRSQPLEKRTGSTKDRILLEKTMQSLNFEVICHKNLDHKKMLEYIKHIIQYRVHPDHSIFILCVLTHGVRGYLYAADSVKVKIDNVQNLLDEGLRARQLEIPKVMIFQACRVNNDDDFSIKLSADGPPTFVQTKLDFLIYWATAPELEAYRHADLGSIFIQILCYLIQKKAKHEHLYDIFTEVTHGVAKICKESQKDQVPTFESTLRKKLYLQIPE